MGGGGLAQKVENLEDLKDTPSTPHRFVQETAYIEQVGVFFVLRHISLWGLV